RDRSTSLLGKYRFVHSGKRHAGRHGRKFISRCFRDVRIAAVGNVDRLDDRVVLRRHRQGPRGSAVGDCREIGRKKNRSNHERQAVRRVRSYSLTKTSSHCLRVTLGFYFSTAYWSTFANGR